MKTYKSFEEYMYDNYYDQIFNKVTNFLFQKKNSSFLSSGNVLDVNYFEMEDFHIEGATFHSTDNNILDFRLTLTVNVSVFGKSRYDYDSESKSVWVSIYFTSLLENGLYNVRITRVDEYSQEQFKKESKLDHFFVPYLYNEDADDVAEKFLKEHYPAAVETPMPLPIDEIVRDLGLKIYYAPLNDTTFGRTYFDKADVTVYTDFQTRATADITISAGTLLINPDVYFMRNVGSVNNTIIHECVHWKKHRMFFELKKLLNQDFSYISCEIVESYGKEKSNSTPLDWIEWQANTLAPKILMPATTTKKFIQDRLYNLRQSMSASARDADVMAQAIQDAADFFRVSRVTAKLRAIELGFEQAYGVYVYIENRMLPHFSFASKVIGKNGGFVIDSISALSLLITHPVLDTLYSEEKIVFVNNMLCLNAPKYIKEHPEMTPYALDHIDECCFLFRYKKRVNFEYDDSYYRACFLCREVTADSFIEAEYNPDDGKNQLTEEEAAAIEQIMKLSQQYEIDFDELPGSFHKTVDYHITRKGLTAEELSWRSRISTQTISELRNKTDKPVKIETLLKLFIGLNLNKEYCYDLMKKAGIEFPKTMTGRFYRWLVDEHTDESIEHWQLYLNQAHINLTLCKLNSRKTAQY